MHPAKQQDELKCLQALRELVRITEEQPGQFRAEFHGSKQFRPVVIAEGELGYVRRIVDDFVDHIAAVIRDNL